MIPDPEVSATQLGPQHAFVVLATDGVWEFISSQKAVEIVSWAGAGGAGRRCCGWRGLHPACTALVARDGLFPTRASWPPAARGLLVAQLTCVCTFSAPCPADCQAQQPIRRGAGAGVSGLQAVAAARDAH